MSWVIKSSNDFAFWLSPDGQLTEFEYADVALNGPYHNDAIEELLALDKREMEEVLQAENPSDELIKRGWTRGIKEGRLTYIETSSEDKVEQILGWLPFITSKLIIDVGDEHLGLLLNEDEDFVAAWRHRDQPRVFANKQ